MALAGKLYQVVESEPDEAQEENGKPSKKKLQRKKVAEVETKVVQSICKPITEGMEFEKASQFKYLFNDVDIVEDVSLGLRGYNRNIDRLSNQLIQWHKKMYPQTVDMMANRKTSSEYDS